MLNIHVVIVRLRLRSYSTLPYNFVVGSWTTIDLDSSGFTDCYQVRTDVTGAAFRGNQHA